MLIRREMSNDYVIQRKTKTSVVRAARTILVTNAPYTDYSAQKYVTVGDDRLPETKD